MRNPIKWIAEAISSAWYRLKIWYTVKMWHLFDDAQERAIAGYPYTQLVHDHSHEMIVRACTRKKGHDGPCNGFPVPGHRVWDETLGRAVPLELKFPNRPIVPQKPLVFDDAPGEDDTVSIDKAIEAGEEASRERRRVLARKRYAIAHGKRTFVGFNGVTCRLPKKGTTKSKK